MGHPRPFLLRLSITSVGFVLLIGHGSAGGDPSCSSCRSCGPQCRDIDDVDAYFDVDGCWFDAIELQYPAESCGVIATLHPNGEQVFAGVRRRRSNPRHGFVLDTSRVRCEATSPDGESVVTDIVCTDSCPMPGDDRSCSGTLRLRDTALGEPIGEAEIPQCPIPDGGMPDLGMPDAPDASMSDATTDGELDAMSDADAAMDTDAAMDAGADTNVDAL